jgi:hypothetical protein
MCGEFFDSRKQLREHIDIHHRITNSKMAAGGEKKRSLTIGEEEKQREKEQMPTSIDTSSIVYQY